MALESDRNCLTNVAPLPRHWRSLVAMSLLLLGASAFAQPQPTPFKPAFAPTVKPVNKPAIKPAIDPVQVQAKPVSPAPSEQDRANEIARIAQTDAQAARGLRQANITPRPAYVAMSSARPVRVPGAAFTELVRAGYERTALLEAVAIDCTTEPAGRCASRLLRSSQDLDGTAMVVNRRFSLSFDSLVDALLEARGQLALGAGALLFSAAAKAQRLSATNAVQTGLRYHRDGHLEDDAPDARDMYRILRRDIALPVRHFEAWALMTTTGYAAADLWSAVSLGEVDATSGQPEDGVANCTRQAGAPVSSNPLINIDFSTQDLVTVADTPRRCYVQFADQLRNQRVPRSQAAALIQPALRCTPANHRHCATEMLTVVDGILAEARYPDEKR